MDFKCASVTNNANDSSRYENKHDADKSKLIGFTSFLFTSICDVNSDVNMYMWILWIKRDNTDLSR